MSNPAERTFSSDFKRFFVRGLVILLPSVLTLWIVYAAYNFVDDRIAQPINRGVRMVLSQAVPYWDPLRIRFEPSDEQVQERMMEAIRFQYDPTEQQIEEYREALRETGETVPGPDRARYQLRQHRLDDRIEELHRQDRRVPSSHAMRLEMRRQNIFEWWVGRWYMDFIGLIIAVVAVYTAGRLLGGYFGRRIYERLEVVITSIPVFKQVYPYVRQIVDFLFSEDQPIKFNRVVVVEYPRRGIWSVGFLTGPTLKSVAARSGRAVTVFIPSSPTPFTGYTITVPQEEVIEVPISVDEAIRFAVSGGVLIPDHQQSGDGPQIVSDELPEGLSPAKKSDQSDSSRESATQAETAQSVSDEKESGSSERVSGKRGKRKKGRPSKRNQSP